VKSGATKGQGARPTLAAVFCLLLGVLACAQANAGISVAPFGQTRAGVPVEKVTLENDKGMGFSSIDFGATIMAITLPGSKGQRSNIVLGLPDVAAYENSPRRFGGVIGRYAGRINNARFTLNGKVIELVPNARGIAIHGDPDSYDKRVWQRREFADADSLGVTYRLTSPDGDQRMPGRLEVELTYRLLRKHNELRMEYRATTDAPTVINLTNHAYFNLAGATSGRLDTHRFQFMADRYAEHDAKKVPLGPLLPVAGTALDFRQPANLMPRLQASSLLGDPPGFDHALVFADRVRPLTLVARIHETTSRRTMEIRTTEPSVLFNSGNGFDGKIMGADGLAYQRHAGFAFETQHLPDSPNQPHFPSTVLVPGQVYQSVTTFTFK
jgi:aldose 1-epimerase